MYRNAPCPSREEHEEAVMREREKDGTYDLTQKTLPLPVVRVMLEKKQSVNEREETEQKEENKEDAVLINSDSVEKFEKEECDAEMEREEDVLVRFTEIRE